MVSNRRINVLLSNKHEFIITWRACCSSTLSSSCGELLLRRNMILDVIICTATKLIYTKKYCVMVCLLIRNHITEQQRSRIEETCHLHSTIRGLLEYLYRKTIQLYYSLSCFSLVYSVDFVDLEDCREYTEYKNLKAGQIFHKMKMALPQKP